MASNGYPKVTAKAWRALRSRAAAAPSTKFIPSTVATLMGMASPESARANTVRPMRKLGLIDDDGALTERGNKWRVDASYADACQEILEEVYPSDLLALTDSSGEPDGERVKAWFDHRGFGESNARQMAATYVMIASKQVPEAVASKPKRGRSKGSGVKRGTSPATQSTARTGDAVANPTSEPSKQTTSAGPNLHLDIQIHIPADASAEQIDQIFESMARHVYKQ